MIIVSDASGATLTHLSISAVERDTGLSKDVLRVWERRYGFPNPERDANGERLYPVAQVERLRSIKRLMDAGHRPGKLLALDEGELDTLATRQVRAKVVDDVGDLQRQILSLLQQHDAVGLRQTLAQLLMKQGLQEFVAETIAPLNRAVGEAWMRGEMQIFQEHAYTEQVQVVLRSAVNAIPHRAAHPTVLLATFPNEQHGLGLLMVESILAPEGAHCISLGTQVPIPEIAEAALAYKVDAVALSFSSAYSSKQALTGLESLRALLPDRVAMWVGGELIRRLRRDMTGIVTTGSLADILAALRQWRAEHATNHK
jgi:DNA-binding transcriptional MerR regulator/methylmalonyl-CoA mutase cobalamin-binding subunit